jgi:nucleoside-diphosphate-sugar epimerase
MGLCKNVNKNDYNNTMKIVVTGASGLIGTATVRHLLKCGHEIIATDRRSCEFDPGFNLIVGDLNNLEFCKSLMQGSDALIHLAAIPNPVNNSQFEVFSNNVVSTFAIFNASAEARIRIVTYASSLSIYGFPFSIRKKAPKYVPVDEKHVLDYDDSYALSKYVNELSAKMWFERTGLSFVGLRLPWICNQGMVHELNARSVDEGIDLSTYFSKSLWCYLDIRDAVAALETVVSSNFKGNEVFTLSADCTMLTSTTFDLMKKFYPDCEILGNFSKNIAPYSSIKFNNQFGFKPKF